MKLVILVASGVILAAVVLLVRRLLSEPDRMWSPEVPFEPIEDPYLVDLWRNDAA